MKARALLGGPVLAAALLLGACNPPKYVTYRSEPRDWLALVPWGWNVMTDASSVEFSHVNFIGPFDPSFYLGAPSFSVRWFAYNRAHRMPDGLLESYSSADDFITQTIRDVYGTEIRYATPLHEIKVDGGKMTAKHFVILSAAPAQIGAQWGLAIDQKTGARINPRQHAYVVVPLRRGFYVLTYPATEQGFRFYEPQFNQLVNSFRPLTEGPRGPKIEAAPASRP